MSNSLLQYMYMGLMHESERCRKWLGTICSPKMKASVSHSSSWSTRNYCCLVVVFCCFNLSLSLFWEITCFANLRPNAGCRGRCAILSCKHHQKNNREKIWEKCSFSIIIFAECQSLPASSCDMWERASQTRWSWHIEIWIFRILIFCETSLNEIS